MASQNVGSIHYELGLDTSKFDTASRNIQSKLSGMGNAFGGVADAMGNFAFKAAILATTSSVGIGTFVKSAADLQQTSKSFEVLTGNVDTANKLFAQLAKYANTTPFEFPQIAKAGQILLGFGIQSDQVYKRVTMLGDIAAATGADFESLALVFGQVNATGRLMGQDALQLINNKIPITSILAKKLGITVQEVKARMEDGAIGVDVFNQALEETTKQGGFAFHGTEILAQSLNGRLSTLKDTMLEFGRNLIGVKVDPELGLVVQPGGIFDRFSQLVPKISESLSQMTPKITSFVNYLLDHGEEIKNVVLSFAVAFVAAKVAAIGFSIAASANPVGLIAAAIVAFIGVLTYLQLKFDYLGTAWKWLMGVMTAMKPFLDPIVAAFGILWTLFVASLQPAIANLKAAFDQLMVTLKPYMPALELFGKLMLGTVIVAIVAVIVAIAGFISIAVNVAAAVARAGASIVNFFVGTKNSVLAIWNSLVQAVSGFSLINAGRDLINGLNNGLWQGAGNVINTIRNICKNALNEVKKFFGIRSPSKVMANQGNFIMQGLGVGIEDGTASAIKSAKQSMASVSSMMNGTAALDTVLSNSVRQTPISGQGQAMLGGAQANVYVYGDTILNGETDQQKYLDRLANNFIDVTRGAATI